MIHRLSFRYRMKTNIPFYKAGELDETKNVPFCAGGSRFGKCLLLSLDNLQVIK